MLALAAGCESPRAPAGAGPHDPERSPRDPGDMIAYISPARGLAFYVENEKSLADRHLASLSPEKRGAAAATEFASFRVPGQLAAFLNSELPPAEGDLVVRKNAICLPAGHPCSTDCRAYVPSYRWSFWHPFGDQVPPDEPRSLSNEPPRFQSLYDTNILVTNFFKCVRTNNPPGQICVETYRKICDRVYHSQSNCLGFTLVLPRHDWVCAN